ncbi:MAG: lysylphosphatidylglycerol synthase transmembrane domain-containing protein [Dehalococcoidia bacterium]
MRNPRVWVGTAVSAAFLVLLFWRAGLFDAEQRLEVWGAFAAMQLQWLLLAVPVFATSVWVRAQRWRMIIAPHTALARSDATALVVIGYAANNLLPVRAGELVRAVLVRRQFGGSGATTFGTIVVERVFDGLALTLMLVAALSVGAATGVMAGNAALTALAVLMGVIFGGVSLFVLGFALRPVLVRGLLWRILDVLPEAVGERLRALLDRFLTGLTLVRGAGTWALVALASAAGWLLEAASYWLVGIAFGLALPVEAYLAICAAANLAIAAPSTAGGIGPYEFFAREAAVSFGATAGAATAYALALHAFVLLPITLAGLALLWRRGLRLTTLTHPQPEMDAPAHSMSRG